MKCIVLATMDRDLTYLFLRQDMAFEDLPGALQERFSRHRKVMDLDITPQRKLARGNTATVLADLQRAGYHVQLPPEDDPSGWLDLPPKNG